MWNLEPGPVVYGMNTTPSLQPHPPVGGIVLAAGRSMRMGRPKPLLELGDRSFLDACVSTLRQGGCAAVVTVLAGEADREQEIRARAAGAIVVRNDAARSEQVDSLRLGLEALEAGEVDGQVDGRMSAALVLPVDHPLVTPDTVRILLAQGAAHPDVIVRPIHGGRPGHPTLFPRSLWPALGDPELRRGARSVVESPETRTVDVDVADPGVVADIDTPGAYRRYVGGTP